MLFNPARSCVGETSAEKFCEEFCGKGLGSTLGKCTRRDFLAPVFGKTVGAPVGGVPGTTC
jgi:hypothetical protein